MGDNSAAAEGSLLLVHGAGSGPWIYDDWQPSFPHLHLVAVDLQEELDVSSASMDDYARKVRTSAERLPEPVAVCGWSMGGLVALMARDVADFLILLESSEPAEIQGFHPDVEVKEGAFEPEEFYGAFPPGIRARKESFKARAQRKRGISVPTLNCPSLVVHGSGDEKGIYLDLHGEPREKGRGNHPVVAKLYGSDELFFPGFSHWDLILRTEVRTGIAKWLARQKELKSI